jgi:hypothetical protein
MARRRATNQSLSADVDPEPLETPPSDSAVSPGEESLRYEPTEGGVRFARGLLVGLVASALLWLVIAISIAFLR